MVNKKGQDLSIGTLILIVLGIVVLVLLILGFSMGWTNLWEKINIFGGSGSISTVITNCGLLVASDSSYSYCNDFKKIDVDGSNKAEYVNCDDPRVKGGLSSQLTCTGDPVTVKCQSLAKKDAIVNGQQCGNRIQTDCVEVRNGKIKPVDPTKKDSATCKDPNDDKIYLKNRAGVDVTKPLKEGYIGVTESNICCVPA